MNITTIAMVIAFLFLAYVLFEGLNRYKIARFFGALLLAGWGIIKLFAWIKAGFGG